MATSHMLAEFTPQGLQGVKDAPKRRAVARDLAMSLGGEITQTYLTGGR